MAEIPRGCVEHQPDYKVEAWEAYSIAELGNWVHLLAKRAQHRSDDTKCAKDLHDAQNYLDMMQAKLDELCGNIGTTRSNVRIILARLVWAEHWRV